MASVAVPVSGVCHSDSAAYIGSGAVRPRPPLPAGVVPASRLEVRPAGALALTGIPAIDELAGGLPRGALSEIFGPSTSGRTSVIFSALAEATTGRQEVCALVDASDSFDPTSAAAAGVDLQRLLWIRCGAAVSAAPGASAQGRPSANVQSQKFRALEQVLKTTDLLLQSGGFGMVIVDMGDVPPAMARRIPLTSWFRFRRAVENTPTVLIAIEQEPYAKTCASLVLSMQARTPQSGTNAAHNACVRAVECDPVSPFPAAGRKTDRRTERRGYPNPQCYPDHERVRLQSATDAPSICEVLEFPGSAGAAASARSSSPAPPQAAAANDALPAHARNLLALPIRAELVHARGQKKSSRSVGAFETRTAWAG